MPPQVATAIAILLIVLLFRAEGTLEEHGVSRALWVPYAWMFLSGSRYVSQWLNPAASLGSAEAYLEGSPLDRVVFLVLIILGVVILIRRNLNWQMLFKNNTWPLVFLLFGLTSVLWSDYPFVSFKRWIKGLGTPVMALVILTEERPLAAFAALIRRLSYVLLPLSVLYIKYYPHLGRAYHMGQPMYTGVATQKNGLGQLCLIAGIYYCWDLLFHGQNRRVSRGGRRFPVELVILPMLGWLLYMADSSTSLMGLVIGSGILVMSRVPAVSRVPGRIVRWVLTAVVAFGILELTVGLSTYIIAALGRDPSLTTRVPMWQTLLVMSRSRSQWFGLGYESFWLGKRLAVLWEMGIGVHQAHNAYLETYLNIGLVGLTLLASLIISGLVKARQQMKTDYRFAVLRLTIIVVVAAYSWTEATLHGVSNIWLLLLFAVLHAPQQTHSVTVIKGIAATDSRIGQQRLTERNATWTS